MQEVYCHAVFFIRFIYIYCAVILYNAKNRNMRKNSALIYCFLNKYT